MKTWNLNEIIKNMFDISTIDPKRYVAHWRQTKWLVGSSFVILMPGIYGYINKEYYLSTCSIATGLCSINFWRDANYSWRRTVDCIMAKINITVFTIIGPRYVTKLSFIIAGWSGLVGTCMCYFILYFLCVCGCKAANKVASAWPTYALALYICMRDRK